MWKYVYSVYNNVMREHSAPFVANNDQHALRIFETMLKNDQSGYASSECELYLLCEFNPVSGELRTAQHKRVDIVPADPQQDLFPEED